MLNWNYVDGKPQNLKSVRFTQLYLSVRDDKKLLVIKLKGSPSQPSQLYRASNIQQKQVAPFDRVNGSPSQSWIHTDFNIPSSIQ